MTLTEFGIGPLEMACLGATYVFATCALLVSFYFFIRIMHIRKTSKEIFPFLARASMFLSLGIAHFFISWFQYYWWNNGWIILELNRIFILTELIGGAVMLLLMEYTLKKTKFILSAYLIFLIAISFIINDFPTLNLIWIIGILPAIIFALPMFHQIFIKPTSSFLRRRMYFSLIGTLIITTGLTFRVFNYTRYSGLIIYLIGTFMAIIGTAIIVYSFSAFTTFTDLNWMEKLREIYIINNNGICLYAFSFEKNIDLDYFEEKILMGGVFSSIDKLLAEMMKTKEKIQLIDYKNLKILMGRGEKVFGVLILNEESSFLQHKLTIFLKEFEILFGEEISNFVGDITSFKIAKKLVQHIFELKG
ncbi:MAG: hypothetical protein ACFFDN_18480 [Candidatus Hodarchaeota archaeon]